MLILTVDYKSLCICRLVRFTLLATVSGFHLVLVPIFPFRDYPGSGELDSGFL